MNNLIELPLFPLNTVLFPGMPVHLHIFEPRYRQMIEECSATDQPFGVVLIEHGAEALGPLPEPHAVGCTARIAHIEHLEDGRMNVMALGMERFVIHSLSYEKPYLVGTVEVLPFDRLDSSMLDREGSQLRALLRRYLTVLSQATDNIDVDAGRLPNDPLALAYLAATVLQIPAQEKQPLLAVQQADDLLSDIGALYRREVPLQSALIERDIASTGTVGMGSFSRN
jgi:Lon protease-like protein